MSTTITIINAVTDNCLSSHLCYLREVITNCINNPNSILAITYLSINE